METRTVTEKEKAQDIALGKVIKQTRLELGLSMQDLAKHIGVSFQQVQKYENASNRVSWSRMCSIADALSMTPIDLADEANKQFDIDCELRVM